jgi:hypothetical protein
MYRYFVPAAACLGLCAPLSVGAASSEDLSDLRDQLDALKRAYESRIEALEERLQNAENQVEENRSELTDVNRQGQPAEPAGSQSRINAFNPALSVILQGSVNSYSEDPDAYALPGFQLGGEAGLAREGMTLDETEITASANVDQLFYGQSTIALHEDEGGTEIGVEEAYVDPLALPAGFGARFGRFYSGIGYLNPVHTHAWDFHDEPLAYRAFLGRQFGDDGVRLTWTAPTDLFVTFGAETLAGNSFPAGESESLKGDIQTAFVKLGGDIGVSSAWQGGLSALTADVHNREGGGHQHGDAAQTSASFSGDSDLYIADFVYKWAPNGNPYQHNVKFQTEFFYRREKGAVTFTEDADTALMDYKGDQTGWYAQLVYQFVPRWRLGLRYDWLSADNDLAVTDLGGFTDPDEVIEESGFDDGGHNPQRWSLMLDWNPSEFSRIRTQYNRDESRPGVTDHQWTLQYIMSLGSHGAHQF